MKKITMITTAVAVLLALLILFMPSHSLMISAVDPIAKAPLEEVYQVGSNKPINRAWLDGITLKSTATSVTGTLINASRFPPGPTALIEVDGHHYQKGDFTLSLTSIAMEYGPDHQDGKPRTPRFFNGDGSPTTQEIVQQRHFPDSPKYLFTATYRGRYPALTLYFKTEAPWKPKITSINIYDARTGALLSNGTTRIYLPSGLAQSQELPMFHPAPVNIVLEVALGPMDTLTLPMTPNAKIDQEALYARLITSRPGRPIGQSGSATAGGTYELSTSIDAEADGMTYLSVLQAQRPFILAPQTQNGIALTHDYVGEFVEVWSTTETPAADDAFVLRQYSQMVRIVFSLPQLPGLPEANANITNLADVVIPYMNSAPHAAVQAAADMMQRRLSDHDLENLRSPDTRVFRQVKAGEMVDQYLTWHTRPRAVTVSQQEIIITDTQIQKITSWLKRKLNL